MAEVESMLSSPYKEEWKKGQLLTRGEFGEEVYEVLTDLKKRCAVKIIRLPVSGHEKSDHKELIEKSMATSKKLCLLRHESIMRFYEITLVQDSTVEVLMELITDQTLQKLCHNKPLLEDSATILIKQICDALRYLHSETPNKPCILHRQISANTIVVAADGSRAKLIDLGLAVVLMSAKEHHLSVMRGDPHYMAPELFLTPETEDTLYSCASDIWAFGCVIYFMLVGRKPYSDCRNVLNIGRRIQNKGAPPLPEEFSHLIRSFYAKCTAREREKRTCAADLMKHPLIVGEKETEAPDQDRKPDSDALLPSSRKAEIQYYRVISKRSLCLLINVQQYDETSGFASRIGAEEDTENIKSVFEALNFRVDYPVGTSSADIWRFLQYITFADNLSEFDSLACFIIGHGSDGVVYASDGEEVEINEILTIFRSRRCPALENKPKLFFVQAVKTAEQNSTEREPSSVKLPGEDFLLFQSIVKQGEKTLAQTLSDVIKAHPNKSDDIEALVNVVCEQLELPRVQTQKQICDSSNGAISSLSKKFVIFPEMPDVVQIESPNKWSDKQLSDLCESPIYSRQIFGPMKQTLLMIASARGKPHLVGKLLERDSDRVGLISFQDVQLRTAVSWAAVRGHVDVLKVFEEAFRNDSDALKREVNRQDSVGQTPLILAAMNQQNTAIEQLVKMGAEINHQDFMKFSAVAYAAMEGFDDTVRVLCKLGANAKLADFSRNTPLIWAARGGYQGVIAALREYLCNSADEEHWRASGELGMNAQEWAKRCGYYECASCIQDAIRSLASPTGAASIPSSESHGDNNDSGGSSPAGSSGAGGGSGTADQSQPGSGNSNDGDRPPPPPPGNNERLHFPYSYPLSRRGHRLAIIVNIVDFSHGCDLKRRDGAMEDMREHGLYQTFRHLGFDKIKQYSNVGSDFLQFMLEIDSIQEECKNTDAFLLCLMSHGEQSYIFAHDGVRVRLETIFQQFRRCEGLHQKPKIFIVQACRALDSDRFTARQPGELNSGMHEDCLYVYSTFKRNISFRDGNIGGYFTRALRDTILTNFDSMTEEIRAGLTKTFRRVTDETNVRQVPVYLSTLTRMLHLTPRGLPTAE